MVFFVCEGCGESVKKNQVEKHQMRCRRSDALSCVDCSKVFHGQAYTTHLKCISEEAKYSGKDFVAKENKGEAKQEAWVTQVQQAIAATDAGDGRLRQLLDQMLQYPNIPRKQAKFDNFLKNSLRTTDASLRRAAWQSISTASAAPTPTAPAKRAAPDAAADDAVPTKKRLDDGAQTPAEFKWKSAIKRALRAQPDGRMKLSKLRSRVLDEYSGDSADPKQLFLDKLTKLENVHVEGKVVVLV